MRKIAILLIVVIITLTMVITAAGMEAREGPNLPDATRTATLQWATVTDSIDYIPEFYPTVTPPEPEYPQPYPYVTSIPWTPPAPYP